MPTRRIMLMVVGVTIFTNVAMHALIRPFAARHASEKSGTVQDVAQAALVAV
jgi:hypothetical protein